MNRSDWRILVGSLLAVAVPATILHFSTHPDRLAAGLTAPPFGWPRLLVAHLVSVLPLAWLLAAQWSNWSLIGQVPTLVWGVVGLLFAGAETVVGPELADIIVGLDIDVIPALLVRSLIGLGLALPWCLAVHHSRSGELSRLFWIQISLSILAATVPCAFYTDALVTARTEQVRDLLQRERVLRAERLMPGLLELVSRRKIAGKTLPQLARELALSNSELLRSGQRALPPQASPETRLLRALLLMRIDRLEEATHLLESLTPRTRTISLLLATLHRDLDQLAESTALFESVWHESLPRAGEDSEARADFLTATEGLLFNYREQHTPAETERMLKRGLESLPSQAAFFHFQLGHHYADGGRPELALTHLRQAIELDPKRFETEAEQLIRRLRMQTPGCLLPRRG